MHLLAFLAALHVWSAHGLALRTPPSWHPVARTGYPCSDPAARLAVAGPDGELVLVVERLADPARDGPKRPRFALAGAPQQIACCAPRPGRGWLYAWVERRRELYAYVYVGHGSRATVSAVLRSLEVSRRR